MNVTMNQREEGSDLEELALRRFLDRLLPIIRIRNENIMRLQCGKILAKEQSDEYKESEYSLLPVGATHRGPIAYVLNS